MTRYKIHDTTYELSSTALQLLKADFTPLEHNIFQVLLDDPAYKTEVGNMIPKPFGSLSWTDKNILMAGDHKDSTIMKYWVRERIEVDQIQQRIKEMLPTDTADLMLRLINRIPVRKYQGEPI